MSSEIKLGKEINVPQVHTQITLRQVLLEHFGPLIGELPIKGGWGYSEDDAIIIDRLDHIVDLEFKNSEPLF